MGAVKLVIGWIRNNAVTVVEALKLIYTGVELILNGAARLVPGNAVIKAVNDFLKKGENYFDVVKEWLLKHNF